ncbi:hypothetical protein ACFSR7_34460 [Cohnella sp. GCM10020058]|uniref:hypothetical protein n=1 Tax=Cohnella sp. GCM10020058 TaxID=3317330 RepID=UPI00363A3079
MTQNDNEERRKRILENFDSSLPSLYEKARVNEARLKAQYEEKLLSKLLEALQHSVLETSFNNYMSNLSILSLEENSYIVFGTDSEIKRHLLETRYTRLIESLVSEISGSEYKVTFVVANDDQKNGPNHSKPTAFEFLFEGRNNEYDEDYKNYIKDKNIDELFELAFGKEEYERQKALYERRMEQPDFHEDGINMFECPMCGCNDVPNKTVTVPVNMHGIISVNIQGAKCSNPECLEEFYNSKHLEAIREFEILIKRQMINDRIKPMHLQSEEYKKTSQRAAQDEEENC